MGIWSSTPVVYTTLPFQTKNDALLGQEIGKGDQELSDGDQEPACNGQEDQERLDGGQELGQEEDQEPRQEDQECLEEGQEPLDEEQEPRECGNPQGGNPQSDLEQPLEQGIGPSPEVTVEDVRDWLGRPACPLEQNE